MLQKKIGRIHPAFFAADSLFKKFKREDNKKGVSISSSFFDIQYIRSGVLVGDDQAVLDDISDLLAERYGSTMTRDRFKEKIKFDTITRKWNVLNVGVCILPDDIAGWDGKINSVWFDNENPGEIIDTYFQYWNYRPLLDMCKKGTTDIKDDLLIPNIIDALMGASDVDKQVLRKFL